MKKRQELSDEQNQLRFKTIKMFPALGRISIIIGIIMGIVYFKKTQNPIWIMICGFVGAIIYGYFAYKFKCPNCKQILRSSADILGCNIDRCPNCGKKLNEK